MILYNVFVLAGLRHASFMQSWLYHMIMTPVVADRVLNCDTFLHNGLLNLTIKIKFDH